MSERASEITGLIREWEAGRPGALNQLVEAVYPDLRRIAHRYCQGERESHTLGCTAVVHEAYLRLAQGKRRNWKDRAHFFSFAARLMCGILVDYARARRTAKRGGVSFVISGDGHTPAPRVDILELDTALDELAQLDAFQARIIELRYFIGLSIPETAELTGVSESTVKREWIVAKTWIRRKLLAGSPQP